MEMDDEFREFLQSMGYTVSMVDDPLDTIYVAISIVVYGSPSSYEQVRMELANYVAVHEEEFAYIRLENNTRVTNPKIEKLLPIDRWNIQRDLAAATHLYDLNLVIITDDRHFVYYPDEGGHKRTMTLSYENMNVYSFHVLTLLPTQSPDEPA